MGTFAYSSGEGQSCWQDIVALCRTSGIQFSVSSSVRNESGSWHNSGNAVDLVSSSGNMQQLAAWLESNYTPQLLELIHSGGQGYFVKEGRKVDAGFYGAATVGQHYNHVHVAMTSSGIAAAGSGGTAAVDAALDTSSTPSGSGCAVPALLGLLIVNASALGVGTLIWEGVRWLK